MPPLLQQVYTERDYAILRSLFESRLMTRVHLAAIHFGGHDRMAKKRLQKLAADGLIGDRPRRPDEPKLHYLRKRGYDLLNETGRIADYPKLGYASFKRRVDVSPLTLAHELAVMDVKAAIFSGARQRPTLQVAEFSTWPILFRFRVRSPSGRMAWLSPDAFVRLRERDADGVSEQLFYVEVDRSTESLTVLCRKAAGYLDHFQSGGMAVRLGGKRDDFRQYAFRVLWVFRNAERRNNAAAAFIVNNPPVLTQAWMTTMQELVADPMGAIWIRPKDYRDAVRDTTFDVSHPTDSGYRRQSERDEHVERIIAKQPLI